jgi:hypothetical protein
MMRQFPNNDPNKDRDLVQFLKRYQPIAPTAASNLEDRVMAQVRQNPRSSDVNRRLWVIPSAIAALLCLAWGGSRWLEPTPQFAVEGTQSQELAAFLVENWQTVSDSSTSFHTDPTSSGAWQSLTYPEMLTYSSD